MGFVNIKRNNKERPCVLKHLQALTLAHCCSPILLGQIEVTMSQLYSLIKKPPFLALPCTCCPQDCSFGPPFLANHIHVHHVHHSPSIFLPQGGSACLSGNITETNSVLQVHQIRQTIRKRRLATENGEKKTWGREEMRVEWPSVESFRGVKRKSKDLSPLSLLSYYFFFLDPE